MPSSTRSTKSCASGNGLGPFNFILATSSSNVRCRFKGRYSARTENGASIAATSKSARRRYCTSRVKALPSPSNCCTRLRLTSLGFDIENSVSAIHILLLPQPDDHIRKLPLKSIPTQRRGISDPSCLAKFMPKILAKEYVSSPNISSAQFHISLRESAVEHWASTKSVPATLIPCTGRGEMQIVCSARCRTSPRSSRVGERQARCRSRD